MLQGFYRELKRYTLEDIAFIVTGKRDVSEAVRKAINTLRRYGVLKAVKSTVEEYAALENEDIVLTETISDSTQVLYSFDFVGVILIDNFVFKVYPKYIETTERLLIKFKQILRVIEKYNNKNQIIYLHSGEDDDCVLNKLALELYLLQDYFMNGLYNNEHEIIDVNGTGEVLWDKTINEAFTFIKNNKPYYFDLYTRDMQGDEKNYFRRLHQCILTKISNELYVAGMLELFDIEPIELTSETLDDFGDIDTVLYRLLRELQVQFVTRKQRLLKTLIVYLDNRKAGVLENQFRIFGTNSFNQIWEEVCQNAFANMLEEPLETLPKTIKWTEEHKYYRRKHEKLIEIIEHPIWHKRMEEKGVRAPKTLIPDLVCIFPYENNYCFGIFDAKYYNIHFYVGKSDNKNYVTGQPGVGDITKQYLYQLAYMDFIREQKYKYVTNMFLCPCSFDDEVITDKNSVVNYGYVELNMLHNLGTLKLVNILVLKLAAERMFELYLHGKNIDNLASFLPEQTVSLVEHELNTDSVHTPSNITVIGDKLPEKDVQVSLFAANYKKYQYPKETSLKFQARLIYEMLYDLVKGNFYFVEGNDPDSTKEKVADSLESSAETLRIELAEVAVEINEELSTISMVELDGHFDDIIHNSICSHNNLRELIADSSKYNFIVSSLKDMYLDLYN